MLLQEDVIEHYIPQRSPMVMVHTLKEVSEEHAITCFAVRPDNVFVKDNALQEPGLIENMAQTAAVHEGYHRSVRQESVKTGYIAAIKNLKIQNLPPVGATIETMIRIKNVVLNVVIVEGTVQHGDEVLATAEIRIFNQL
jgi:3-hydroxyacyl-[acyl-carrier-protein] dehydratase